MRSRAARALVALVALVAGDDAPRKPPLLRQHGARDLHAGGEDLPSLPAVPPLGERTRMRWTPPADAPCPEGGVTELQLFLPAAWTRTFLLGPIQEQQRRHARSARRRQTRRPRPSHGWSEERVDFPPPPRHEVDATGTVAYISDLTYSSAVSSARCEP